MLLDTYYENLIKKDTIELLKWFPGIIFPLGNIMQIIEMYKEKKANQIDEITYIMFFIGNLGGFLFNRMYISLKTWLAYIIPSIQYIYILTLKYRIEGEKSKEIVYSTTMSIILFIVLFTILLLRKNKSFQSIMPKSKYRTLFELQFSFS